VPGLDPYEGGDEKTRQIEAGSEEQSPTNRHRAPRTRPKNAPGEQKHDSKQASRRPHRHPFHRGARTETPQAQPIHQRAQVKPEEIEEQRQWPSGMERRIHRMYAGAIDGVGDQNVLVIVARGIAAVQQRASLHVQQASKY